MIRNEVNENQQATDRKEPSQDNWDQPQHLVDTTHTVAA